MNFIQSEVSTKVTASLKEEIKAELEIPDPTPEKAKAAIDDSISRTTTES